MAFSQSIGKGQIAIVCQLCENEPKIKWKCLQCKLMMCQRCRDKVHPKFPSASDHTIIDIKETRTQEEESEQNLDFSTLKCPVHKGQNCCLFCKTCMDVVCPTCIAKTHKSHDLVEMVEGYEFQMGKANNFKTNNDAKIQDLSKGEENLGKIKLAEQSKYNKAKQEICNQEEAIVKAAKKCKDKLLDELDQNWNNLQKSIDKEGDNVKKEQKRLAEQSEKIRNILQSKDAQKVFSSSQDLFSSKDEKIEVKMSFNRIPNFVGGKLDGVSSLFGSLDEVTTNQELTLQVLDHYKTNLDRVFSMSVCPDDTIWIGNTKVIQHVKPENHSTKIISEITVFYLDIALLPSGDLLMTTADSHLKLVPHGTSQIKHTHNITPGMKTFSVHVSHSNNIIVTASSNSELYSNDGSRQVMVMDQTGKTLKVHEYDRNGKPLFTLPGRVRSNSINNIGVIDLISEDFKGRIVVLDQEGEVNNIYTGHQDVNNEDNQFSPRDIVATHSDNFVISDPNNYTLHILNEAGHFVTYCNIKKLIDCNPNSLAISETNHLYIGTVEKEGMAKIYKTDISGW